MHPRKQQVLNIIKTEPESMDELAKSIIVVINHMVAPKNELVGFKWTLDFTEKVSNTHNCPLNGVTNWGSKEDKPRHYPGWYGRVWYRYKNTKDFSLNLNNTLTYTGTGGYGSYNGPWAEIAKATYTQYKRYTVFCYSYDFRLFEDDWPKIKEWRQHVETFKILKNEPLTHHHTFLWEDSETKINDIEFLKNFNKVEA